MSGRKDGWEDRRTTDLLWYEFNIPYFSNESVAKNEVALLFVNQTKKKYHKNNMSTVPDGGGVKRTNVFVLILYVPVIIFSVMSSWVETVLSRG